MYDLKKESESQHHCWVISGTLSKCVQLLKKLFLTSYQSWDGEQTAFQISSTDTINFKHFYLVNIEETFFNNLVFFGSRDCDIFMSWKLQSICDSSLIYLIPSTRDGISNILSAAAFSTLPHWWFNSLEVFELQWGLGLQ